MDEIKRPPRDSLEQFYDYKSEEYLPEKVEMIPLSEIPDCGVFFKGVIAHRMRLSEVGRIDGNGWNFADSPNAHITFKYSHDTNEFYILVTDHNKDISQPEALIEVNSIEEYDFSRVISENNHNERFMVTFHGNDYMKTRGSFREKFVFLLKPKHEAAFTVMLKQFSGGRLS